jgi:crossover junction endodeoxyribonuclease RuvC
MVKLLLGLAAAPSPHDAADALAVAICHLHSMPSSGSRDPEAAFPDKRQPRSWRQYRPPTHG